MPSSLGPAEILVILVFALIILGPKRLPEAGRQVGKALAEVRKWSQGFQSEIRSVLDPEPEPGARTPTPMADSPNALDDATRASLAGAGVIAQAESLQGVSEPLASPADGPHDDAPGSQSPEAAVPEAAVPEAAVPEAAVPEAALAEAAVPDKPTGPAT